MKGGDISNVPAPLIYFDGATFIRKRKILGYKSDSTYCSLMEDFYKNHTVYIWFDPEWIKGIIDRRSPVLGAFMYNDVLYEPISRLMWRLQKKKGRLITGRSKILKAYPNTTVSISLPFDQVIRIA